MAIITARPITGSAVNENAKNHPPIRPRVLPPSLIPTPRHSSSHRIVHIPAAVPPTTIAPAAIVQRVTFPHFPYATDETMAITGSAVNENAK
eukprot:CAMPEP_0172328276 /NCGR_PEP_ID=MMETSP1058-20130122/60271_1 /TAXON_ID=83371 /ORGANISM="Detonula confervacea, Strain CCMP 353" /LENGTH=91 /DNA_ID=CAMNT_0013045385 /DNA_START=248 /DNA_END=524 /DNA_ORIENTATION=+